MLWRKLLFPIKVISLMWRFCVLLLWTAYLEGGRDVRN